ncbi:Deoxyadenosine/deoxycytidine kinase [Clostridium collagenovorans DSM 3089]|uniref:Deoxyadenosine/deoxycytidine kinase n=1 Tax=Clostridium collagenovorans DSM 3089 TaxID=1121306 RepID=A0A1M5TDD8_9CLOT|nr:deoxynucleoside kinase [Clostridium collagenovorans]SHH48724.1 Deoxyadenosine/deoxycytidine kinase [Clostridium collagenovorans DSM 3089]
MNEYKNFFELIENKRKEEVIMNAIIIDGPVGVGKTSLMEILVSEFGYKPFLEPVSDNPLLDKFYYNRKRYSFPLQIFFLNRRFAMLKDAQELDGTIMDRSIYGDVIFARMLCDGGDMEKEEYALYKELLANMLEHVQAPKLIIYLETSVDKVIEKIKKRGRDYEQVVEREYWEQLNKEYRDYFNYYNISPILKINVDDLDYVNNNDDRNFVINLIKNKLEEINKK